MKRRQNSGFTLIELMIVVAIIAILAVLAAPSFKDTLQTQRVEGAAEALMAALQNAKAEAIKTNTDMALVFMPADTDPTIHNTWCYGMTKAGDATCVCTVDADASNDCANGSVVRSTDYSGISVKFNTSNSRNFKPLRGTVTPGTITLNGGNNKSLGVSTLAIGRIRICKPAGSTVPGYSGNGAC